MTKLRLFYVLGFVLLALLAPVAYQVDRAAMSLPKLDGEARVAGLSAPVEVEFDGYGIPTVAAANRADAFRALGFLHARDRLFQMDLMRRKSAGRLAEIFGDKAVAVDLDQRGLQLQDAAAAIVAALPPGQRAVAAAYAAGVNAHIESAREVPPEFRLLKYKPEPWREEDSILVALGMFQTLGLDQMDSERMLTVMEEKLPAEVAAFLTPDTDEYTQTLVGGSESRRPPRPVPAEALARLLDENRGTTLGRAAVDPDPVSVGSNNWAVSGRKTLDGRAMIADDMHLPLGIPNVWYRARLRYGTADLTGTTLPGVPVVVVGSNGHVAWGFTNVDGDFLDLVRLEVNPANPSQYRTPAGWQNFETRTETVRVKDADPVTVELQRTHWGPVAATPLLGQPVAFRWAALDPAAVNLGLLDMDTANSLETAMAVLNRAGSPPQNVVLADDRGRIGWTYMGAFPRRRGFDGSVSLSFADGRAGWDGYLAPEDLPRVVDPPEGFLATANNRTVGKAYPYPIGHSFSNGYRAFRIRERLAAAEHLTEKDMFALQLDTTSGFYEFYRQLALGALAGDSAAGDPILEEARREIEAWNGRLDPDSRGIGLLVRWRSDLAKAVFSPVLGRCVGADPHFAYQWRQQETPLRELLRQQIPATLPDRRQPHWPAFLRATLAESSASIKREHEVSRLEELPWGKVNAIRVQHPFSRALPAAGAILDMPELAGACNSFCLKVLHGVHGASERLAVSPNHPEDGILHMPGGQSGHPFSPHYRDQQDAWTAGMPLPFMPGQAEHRLRLTAD
jgi:penicillin amidase